MYWVKKIHKWTSVIIGIQLFIWVASGLTFNVIDHQKAKGNTYRQQGNVAQDSLSKQKLITPKHVLLQYPDTVELTQISLLNQPYYLLTKEKGLYQHFKNSYQIINAETAELTVIDEQLAQAIAAASYKGPGTVTLVSLVSPPIADFTKQKNPSWRVDYRDDLNTSVYIEQGSGRVVGHSNDNKRFADFFFMLHFMDYGNQGSFNNIPMMIFAFITLWLALSGLVWIVNMVAKGQYRAKKNRRTAHN
jgi:uncharacterized iron-regulated membrane protein